MISAEKEISIKRHWSAQDLVLLGVFAAATKISTLLVALAGGGMNPVSLLMKNLIFTTLLVVMLYKIRKSGTLILFVIVNVLISTLLLGASITLLPSMLLAAILGEALILLLGGMQKAWAPVLAVFVYDLASKILSVFVSWLFMRENPALLYMILPILVIGYVGSFLGLFSGLRAVKELSHAGIVRN